MLLSFSDEEKLASQSARQPPVATKRQWTTSTNRRAGKGGRGNATRDAFKIGIMGATFLLKISQGVGKTS